MKAKSTILYSVLCILLFLGIASCSRQPSSSESHRPLVVVTVPPQEALIREIAGDSVDVITLLKPGSNPETFEVTVNDLKAIRNADLFLTVGNLPFEQITVSRLLGDNSDHLIVNTTDSVSLIHGTHHSHHSKAHSHDHGEDADPHTWSSLRNLRLMASATADALVSIDPENAPVYRANHLVLDRKIDSIDRAVARKLLPAKGSSFIVWHPSLSYFARDYGLNQIAIGEENKEMSAKRLRDKIDAASASGQTAVMFIQPSIDSRQASDIARQTRSRIVEINPLSPDWEQQINIVTDAIATPYTD